MVAQSWIRLTCRHRHNFSGVYLEIMWVAVWGLYGLNLLCRCLLHHLFISTRILLVLLCLSVSGLNIVSDWCICTHTCSLTWKERVCARQAGLVGGVPPAQPPQAAAALLHLHQGGVVNAGELLAAPRGVTVTTHAHSWEKDIREMRSGRRRGKRVKSRGLRTSKWENMGLQRKILT